MPPYTVNILESRYVGPDGIMALALAQYECQERWVAYCPSDMAASHHSIVQAHAAGLLTGQLAPTPWSDGRTFEMAQDEKRSAIEAHTQEVRAHGIKKTISSGTFVFDTAGPRAIEAMLKLHALAGDVLKGLVPNTNPQRFPRTCPAFDPDTGKKTKATLSTALEAFAFVYNLLETDEALLAGGVDLLEQVDKAETIEEVDAIEDNR